VARSEGDDLVFPVSPLGGMRGAGTFPKKKVTLVYSDFRFKKNTVIVTSNQQLCRISRSKSERNGFSRHSSHVAVKNTRFLKMSEWQCTRIAKPEGAIRHKTLSAVRSQYAKQNRCSSYNQLL
jgi:hypothetical protein